MESQNGKNKYTNRDNSNQTICTKVTVIQHTKQHIDLYSHSDVKCQQAEPVAWTPNQTLL